MVFNAETVIEPVAVVIPQPPVSVMLYVYVPDTVGVPLIVNTFAAQLPVTPVGKPVALAPVAPVVLYVILVMAVLIHLVCALVPAADVSVMLLPATTVIAPVDVIAPQPPVRITV